jgi:hypothetical protein
MKPITQKFNTHLLLLLVIASLNLIIFSCGKSSVKPKPADSTKKDTTVKTTGGPDIYVAGYETLHTDFDQNFKVAKVWKNGVATALTNPTGTNDIGDAVANSVFVSGKDVFVAGWIFDKDNFYATLWKNGVATRLSQKTSYAQSVFVVGEDVYVAGYDYPASAQENAVVWKNGVRMPLANNVSNAVLLVALSVYMDGSSMYVAGADDGNAITWVFGAESSISKPYGYANQIIKNGDDVYTAGEIGAPYLEQGDAGSNHIPQATIWKGNSSAQITKLKGVEGGASCAYSVAILADSVYAAGYEYQYKDAKPHSAAIYWKNNTPKLLSANPSAASYILLSGKDVYIAGYDTDGKDYNNPIGKVTVWKNGVPTYYTTGATDARAISMFIK